LRWLAVPVVVVIVFAGATARLLVWPARGDPRHADAIVMLNGGGNRLAVALDLGWSHVAPYLVISRGSTYWGHGSVCAPAIPRVKVICFDPSPNTTQGEAEFVGKEAERYHWKSIILVTSTAQDTRARLRVGRCFHGHISVVTINPTMSQWPYAIVYEWAALAKAVLIQRSC